jgi:hypothetical protein
MKPGHLNSIEVREMIMHLSTFVSPSLSKAHIDYIFQYRWLPSWELGLEEITRILLSAERAVKMGVIELKRLYPEDRDKLRDPEGPIIPLRYYQQ